MAVDWEFAIETVEWVVDNVRIVVPQVIDLFSSLKG
jgi:hypothetical protein